MRRSIVDRMSCEWPVDDNCLPDLPAPDADDYDDKLAARDRAVEIAKSVLWALSGRQFGCKLTTVRPRPHARGLCDDAPLIEAYYRNDYRGVPGVAGSPMAVKLAGPVREIVTVTIGDTDLDPSEYVLEGDVLYRVGKAWPPNDMNKPMGFPGTWSVTYSQGTPPPDYVGPFVAQLAAEFVTACEGGKCRLPRTVVSTSRSGVTHVFDPTRMLAAGFTGVPEIDNWLASVNPGNLATAARIR